MTDKQQKIEYLDFIYDSIVTTAFTSLFYTTSVRIYEFSGYTYCIMCAFM